MNNITNKFLLTADKFMPETHLKYLKVGTYSASSPFTRNKDRIDKFIQTGDTNYIYKNELDKAYEIAKDPKYYGSQRGLASMVYKFFYKKTSGSGINTSK